jgi:hypothetical protein
MQCALKTVVVWREALDMQVSDVLKRFIVNQDCINASTAVSDPLFLALQTTSTGGFYKTVNTRCTYVLLEHSYMGPHAGSAEECRWQERFRTITSYLYLGRRQRQISKNSSSMMYEKEK